MGRHIIFKVEVICLYFVATIQERVKGIEID